jgi:hypothetical protein
MSKYILKALNRPARFYQSYGVYESKDGVLKLVWECPSLSYAITLKTELERYHGTP